MSKTPWVHNWLCSHEEKVTLASAAEQGYTAKDLGMQPKMMDRPGRMFGNSTTGVLAEQKSVTHGRERVTGGLLGVTIHWILVKFELPC